jgi:hypothetical protein
LVLAGDRGGVSLTLSARSRLGHFKGHLSTRRTKSKRYFSRPFRAGMIGFANRGSHERPGSRNEGPGDACDTTSDRRFDCPLSVSSYRSGSAPSVGLAPLSPNQPRCPSHSVSTPADDVFGLLHPGNGLRNGSLSRVSMANTSLDWAFRRLGSFSLLDLPEKAGAREENTPQCSTRLNQIRRRVEGATNTCKSRGRICGQASRLRRICAAAGRRDIWDRRNRTAAPREYSRTHPTR